MGRFMDSAESRARRQTVARAERIAAHRFPLLGYGDLISDRRSSGTPTRCMACARRSSPGGVSRTSTSAVGDHKIVWELSRHQHLVTLVRACLYTGEQRWLDEAVSQWRDWQKANPYPLGINWASTLEVAFRLLAWIWMDHLVATTPRKRSAVN